MYMYNNVCIHVYVHVFIVLLYMYMCMYDIDREHVVDVLPHLWVLDAKMITGKILEYPM